MGVTKHFGCFPEKCLDGSAYVGVVALIARIDQCACNIGGIVHIAVEHGQLDGGGAHVDAEPQLMAGPIVAGAGRDLDRRFGLGSRLGLRVQTRLLAHLIGHRLSYHIGNLRRGCARFVKMFPYRLALLVGQARR